MQATAQRPRYLRFRKVGPTPATINFQDSGNGVATHFGSCFNNQVDADFGPNPWSPGYFGIRGLPISGVWRPATYPEPRPPAGAFLLAAKWASQGFLFARAALASGMAKRSSSIPNYKRQRRRGGGGRTGGGILRFLLKSILGLFLFSILWVVAYRFINPPITATMLGDVVAGRGAARDWMSLEAMDRDMVRAAIGAEDSKFCAHNGFDIEAIEDAMKRNASGGRIRGGSTISQQTAKNVFLWQGGGYARKGAEAYFTFLIENVWGKRRIMEVYLNVAETGIGTYGANAGSMRYFGHDASAMSATEAARIAAILPLPKKRGAVAPKGFTKRYGNSIAARVGVVGRDGLDGCVYAGSKAPVNKAPPKVTRAPKDVPGEDYETATPPPPEVTVDTPPGDPVPTPAPGTPDAPVVGEHVAVAPADEPAPPPEPTALNNTASQ